MKRTTWVLLIIFLLLVGLMVCLNRQESSQADAQITPIATVEYLFSDSDGLPTGLEIRSANGKQVSIERNETGAWVLKQPVETEADQGSVEAAMSQLTTLRIGSKPAVDPIDVGLDSPSYIIVVRFTGGIERSVSIGDPAPSGNGYYTREDGKEEIYLISQTSIDALLNLLHSPPVAVTATP